MERLLGRMGSGERKSIVSNQSTERTCQGGVDGSPSCGHSFRYFYEHPDPVASTCQYENATGRQCGHCCVYLTKKETDLIVGAVPLQAFPEPERHGFQRSPYYRGEQYGNCPKCGGRIYNAQTEWRHVINRSPTCPAYEAQGQPANVAESPDDGEHCRKCGEPVAKTAVTWWNAPDWLWRQVYNTEGGNDGIKRCIPCFTRDCATLGIAIHWEAAMEIEPLDIGAFLDAADKRYWPHTTVWHPDSKVTVTAKHLRDLEDRAKGAEYIEGCAITDARMHEERVKQLEAAIERTLNENSYLTDGDVCTLIDLKRVMPDWAPQTSERDSNLPRWADPNCGSCGGSGYTSMGGCYVCQKRAYERDKVSTASPQSDPNRGTHTCKDGEIGLGQQSACIICSTASQEAPEMIPRPDPISGAEWTQPDILPLLEHAMQLACNFVPCDCDRSEVNMCSGTCVGSEIWSSIHRARKLIRADPTPSAALPEGFESRIRNQAENLIDSVFGAGNSNYEYEHAATRQLRDAITQALLVAHRSATTVWDDSARLDWLESVMRPKYGYQEIYLAGLRSGDSDATEFQCELQRDGSFSGSGLRDAIDAAKEALERRKESDIKP